MTTHEEAAEQAAGWSEFARDAVTVMDTTDRVQLATAALYEEPLNPSRRSQMIEVLTAPEYEAAQAARDRVRSSEDRS